MLPSLFTVPTFSGVHSGIKMQRDTKTRPPRTDLMDTVALRFGATALIYPQDAAAMVRDEGERLRRSNRDRVVAAWDFYTNAISFHRDRLVEVRNQWRGARNHPKAYAKVNALMVSPQFPSLDRATRRGLERLKEIYELAIPRPTDPPDFWPLHQKIKAREVELMQILNTYDNEDLIDGKKPAGYQQTYADMLVDLVKDRNRLARMSGEPDYYVMQLAEQGINAAELQRYCRQLKPILNQLSKTLEYLQAQQKAQRFGWPHLLGESANTIENYRWERQRQEYQEIGERDSQLFAEWEQAQAHAQQYDEFRAQQDIQNGLNISDLLKGQDPTKLLRSTGKAMGIPARYIEQILAKSDLYPRKNKDRGAGCSPIDLPFEVRAFTNINPNPEQFSLPELKLLLHEVFGHGVDFKSINPQLPAILRNQNAATKEAFAVMMELLAYDKNWVTQVLKAQPQNSEKLDLRLKWMYLQAQVGTLRREISQVEFEQSLYQNPDQDLDALYKQTYAFSIAVDPDKLTMHGSKAWAVELPHLTHSSVTYQNYLLGQLWGAQVIERLEQPDIGGFCTKNAGKFLLKHRANGLLYTPEEEIKRMTGKPLNADAMIHRLQRFANDWLQVLPPRSEST